MRNQWLRLLLTRFRTPSQPHASQVHIRSFSSSFLHPRAPQATPKPFVFRQHFSSSPEHAVESSKPLSDGDTLLADIFARPGKSSDEIKLDLDSKNVVITHDLVLSFLKNPNTDPDAARRVFDWVLESQGEKLSSKSYNWMLGILGSRGLVKETWDMIGIMKRKGYGVSKGAFDRIYERFQKDGLADDVEKLKELYALGSASCKKDNPSKENDVGLTCSQISDFIRREVWVDDVEKKLQESNVKYSSDVVVNVLGNLGTEPNKALIFFRWVQESGLFKHDERSFNAMARVLAKEDHSQKFWKFVNEMRGDGHQIERETYVHILERFVKRKMMKDAVDLYEFAMTGGNKPLASDCTFLLKKIVVSKELDMDLFRKVVGVFKANGNVLTDANFNAVLKSLISVGRLNECNRILAAMEEAGYVPSGSTRSKIAYTLSSTGKSEEALEFVNNKAASKDTSDYKTWESLVKGFCVARDFDKASNSLREMIEKEGPTCAGKALHVLIGTYCQKNMPMDAYKFALDMANNKGVTIWNTTYKALTRNLLPKKHFKEALNIMSAMKKQEYPPDLDSFVKYLSRKGSAEESVEFLKAMTSKRFPPTSVFIRLFEAYLKAGRKSEAQDFLSQCPRHIKNHADVLNLFLSGNSGVTGDEAAVSV
ncbi:pentatricopeptide repeat-containing family protein [Striga asiatica]|uniref:Pentatricopeptide repeat-containing family protein n=1 Tax=Striga asiatica TaxID=4170 RepID=A0A5A7QV60_STRAF|nr:pentatricopeptide repeat-containing family protein [Striga asiatica]